MNAEYLGRNGSDFIQRWQAQQAVDPKIFLGYPVNRNPMPQSYLDWQHQLLAMELGSRSYNNIGDPYEWRDESAPHFLETQVIEDYGERLGYTAKSVWGYVSNGGTESNLYGIYMGQTLLEEKCQQAAKLFYTQAAHYSIQVIQNLLKIDAVLIKTLDCGAMDCVDLAKKAALHADAPILVVATLGTTFTGAMDDLINIHHTLSGKSYYLHLDAALFGGYLPVTTYSSLIQNQQHDVTMYHSIAISCHKFFGFPLIAGLFLCQRSQFERFREVFSRAHDPAYISHVPGTITTSRDSLKPALFHYFTSKQSKQDQVDTARTMLDHTQQLYDRLAQRFPALDVRRESSASNIVHFLQPNAHIVDKWSLATINTQHGARAHAVVMPHIDSNYIDLFIKDLAQYQSA